jgi:hypothetical protein
MVAFRQEPATAAGEGLPSRDFGAGIAVYAQEPCPRTLNLRKNDKHVGPCALTEAEGREYDRWLLAKESRPAKRRRDHHRSSAVRYQRG